MVSTKKVLHKGQTVNVAGRPGCRFEVADLKPTQFRQRGKVLVRCTDGALTGMACFVTLDEITPA